MALSTIILLSDGRPIFFVQERIGQRGRTFRCYKFRTMKKDCPSYVEKCKLDSDSFLTSYGRKLRSMSVDELPQLFNVLKGDMSLIGPRPMIRNHKDIHMLRKKYHVDRLKPGLTGLAQVMGRDSLTDEEKVEFDRRYYQHCSMVMDAGILLRTVRVVFTRDGYKEGR